MLTKFPRLRGLNADGLRFCKDAQGNEVQIIAEGTTEEHGHEHGSESGHSHEHESSEGSGGVSCHFHAGVEYV